MLHVAKYQCEKCSNTIQNDNDDNNSVVFLGTIGNNDLGLSMCLEPKVIIKMSCFIQQTVHNSKRLNLKTTHNTESRKSSHIWKCCLTALHDIFQQYQPALLPMLVNSTEVYNTKYQGHCCHRVRWFKIIIPVWFLRLSSCHKRSWWRQRQNQRRIYGDFAKEAGMNFECFIL